MHFGENQLSPRSIGISPLTTTLPSHLQLTLVRASRACYRPFTLAMARSRGFGSIPSHYSRPLRTRFRCGLHLATKNNSPVHSAKGTPSHKTCCAPTACRHTVSGLFHSPHGVLFTFPSRYWFTIGGNAYLALAGGPAGFPQGFSCPVVLGISIPPPLAFAYAPLTLFGTVFQPSSTSAGRVWIVPRPRRPNLRFRLLRFRSPLLSESRLFSLPRRTKMFQFRRCPSFFLCVQKTMTTLLWPGFPIRIPTDQGLLAAPRGVSPLAASFFGTLPQGIRRVPFFASYFLGILYLPSAPTYPRNTNAARTHPRALDVFSLPHLQFSRHYTFSLFTRIHARERDAPPGRCRTGASWFASCPTLDNPAAYLVIGPEGEGVMKPLLCSSVST